MRRGQKTPAARGWTGIAWHWHSPTCAAAATTRRPQPGRIARPRHKIGARGAQDIFFGHHQLALAIAMQRGKQVFRRIARFVGKPRHTQFAAQQFRPEIGNALLPQLPRALLNPCCKCDVAVLWAPTCIASVRRDCPFGFQTGRGGGARTHDPRFWRPMLYQLSYTPKSVPRWVSQPLAKIKSEMRPRCGRFRPRPPPAGRC